MISEPLSFLLDGRAVSYRLRLSRRSRRLALRFTDAGLEVVKPARLAGAAHDHLFRRFEGWIRRQMRRHEERIRRHDEVRGRLLLRGREVRLEVRTSHALAGLASTSERDGLLVVETSPGRLDAAIGSLRAYIFQEAKKDLADRAAVRSREMDQPFGRISIRDQRTLWGSCARASGTLSFNARLVMAPPEVLDYIVVHELAHFRWAGHGVRFWERVARFCADHALHRRWLRTNAWRLRLPTTPDELAPFLVE